ncbi:hypothetical protein CVT26_014943 [Gymnopilus dilepis]|uniref:Uncharacterized protein n=1 Tax=Gymnopilus dilepis TaxID=231916 RepID=A0A409XWW3_9AGAR|nr:hypothetical protein CVT26_014943 [Gymnopilus dilepis]
MCQPDCVTPTAFAPASLFVAASRSPSINPSGQLQARTFPVLEATTTGPFTSYPPEVDAKADESLVYTYASLQEDALTMLHNRRSDIWTFISAVPIPEGLNRPTLLALDYMIKYATTFDSGNSTIQTDTVLTQKSLPEGVVTRATDFGIYKGETGFAPLMIDHEAAHRFSSTLGVKANGAGEDWNHYVDIQHVTPNVRVVAKSNLFVVFHVNEYVSAKTLRSLSIEVSATWQKEEVEIKAKEEAKRKADEEAAQKAKEEAERKQREAEERQAREEERQERAEARQARAEERQERADAKQAREEEKQERAEAKQARAEERQERENAQKEREEARQERKEAKEAKDMKATADTLDALIKDPQAPLDQIIAAKVKALIDTRMAELNIPKCPKGLEYIRHDDKEAYICTA